MLSQIYIAIFICISLTVFFLFNLLNLVNRSSTQTNGKAYAEVERPQGVLFVIAALGTFLFFVITVAYLLLFLSGNLTMLVRVPLQLSFQNDSYVQVFGMIVEAFGFLLFIWSVLSRVRWSVSWEMQRNHQLVTWGPYRFIRHPSYMAYFLMFTGGFLLLLHWTALVPVIAIPGYVSITNYEERLLQARFGDRYIEYQRRTGKFLPKIKR